MIKPDCAGGIPANDQFSGVPATGRYADLGVAAPAAEDALAAMPVLRNRLLADRLDDVRAEVESDDPGLGARGGLHLNTRARSLAIRALARRRLAVEARVRSTDGPSPWQRPPSPIPASNLHPSARPTVRAEASRTGRLLGAHSPHSSAIRALYLQRALISAQKEPTYYENGYT
jgi:hypothetical protein